MSAHSRGGGALRGRHHGGRNHQRPRSYSSAAKDALAQVMARPENQFCADCNMKGPTWASINLGLFMCMDCSGIHRSMGTHVTKVKSTTLDSWKDEWVKVMANMGNVKANAAWEANLPPEKKLKPNASSKERENFIRAKYQRQQWKGKPTHQTAEKAATLIQQAAEEQREDKYDATQTQEQNRQVNPAVARRLAKLRGGNDASPCSLGSYDSVESPQQDTPSATTPAETNQVDDNSHDDILGLGLAETSTGQKPNSSEASSQNPPPPPVSASSFSFLSNGSAGSNNSNNHTNSNFVTGGNSSNDIFGSPSTSSGFGFLKPQVDKAPEGENPSSRTGSEEDVSSSLLGEKLKTSMSLGSSVDTNNTAQTRPNEKTAMPMNSTGLSKVYQTSDKYTIARQCADILAEGMCPCLLTAEQKSKSAVAPSALRDEYTQISGRIDEVANIMKQQLLERYSRLNK